MPLSTQRLVRNQVIFREVNERLRGLADGVPDGHTDYLCECSDVSCTVKIELRFSEYEAVRARPRTFFIVPGHERLEVDRVVDGNERYTIVEKIVPLDDAATRALTTTDETWGTDER
ncbi:MAG: hypothetical protein ACRDM2_04045 [Gaiellaceae bacterium]